MVGSTFERKMGWGTVGEWEYGQAFTESSITPSRLLDARLATGAACFTTVLVRIHLCLGWSTSI